MSKKDVILSNYAKIFDIMYKRERSESFINIFRRIYGDDYPEEAGHDSFVTMTDLRNIIQNLNVKPDETIIDLGCGRGGPGLWIARKMGVNYVGIDLSKDAVEYASRRVNDFGLKEKAKFYVGNICAMDFSDNYFDGAISIDALDFIPDKMSVLREVSRVLKVGSFFVSTTWDSREPTQSSNYRSLFPEAGFEVLVHDEILDWERRQREVYEAILESKKLLIKDMGVEVGAMFIMEAKAILPHLKMKRKLFMVAKKI